MFEIMKKEKPKEITPVDNQYLYQIIEQNTLIMTKLMEFMGDMAKTVASHGEMLTDLKKEKVLENDTLSKHTNELRGLNKLVSKKCFDVLGISKEDEDYNTCYRKCLSRIANELNDYFGVSKRECILYADLAKAEKWIKDWKLSEGTQKFKEKCRKEREAAERPTIKAQAKANVDELRQRIIDAERLKAMKEVKGEI